MKHAIRAAAVLRCALVLQAAFAGSASGQILSAKGSEETLDVATWNVEWFGSTSSGPSDETLQLRNVATVIAQAEVDLWAVQEIDDEDHFEALLDELGPGYDGDLGPSSSNMMVGFIYRLDAVRPIRIADAWLNELREAFAGHPPLLLQARVTLSDVAVDLSFVSLHMKCCGDGYTQRVNASNHLKSRIDSQMSSEPVILLGDFNDELGRSVASGQPSPYENFVADTDAFRFTSLPLEERGEVTWCGSFACSSGSNFDHVLITDELFEAYLPGSTVRYEEVLTAVDDYVNTTSDHVPVVARFAFGSETSVDAAAEIGFEGVAVYPNPFRSMTTVSLFLEAAGPITVEMYDVRGRLVRHVLDGHRAPGFHELSVSSDGLAEGVYFLRIVSGSSRTVRPLVVRR